MPVGTPIRLVKENKEVIELEATNMVLTTSRKVGGSAIPWSGSRRVGMDLNVNKAMINVQGVITDDATGTGGSKAKATINFGHVANAPSQQWDTSANMANLLSSTITPYIRIRDLNNTDRKIFLVAGTNLPGGVKAYYNASLNPSKIQIDHASSSFANDMATAVAAYINGEFGSYFSAATVSGSTRYDDSTSACAVEITFKTNSNEPNGDGKKMPWFIFEGKQSPWFNNPEITKFSGGATPTKKSAGDKVQDIYGIINNSTTKAGRAVTTGVGTGLLAAGALAAVVATGGMAAPAVGTAYAAGAAGVVGVGVGGTLSAAAQKEARMDYICGIQIPYNSMVKSSDGEQYVARNFFMPTGRGFTRSGKGKGSERNDQPASVTFSHDAGEKTGIQGAVQKMDITYDAGETVYNFNLIFAPIDNLL